MANIGSGSKAVKLSLAETIVLGIKKRRKTANLTERESAVIIRDLEIKAKEHSQKTDDMVVVARQTESHLSSVKSKIESVKKLQNKAKLHYKASKDINTKRKWARRVVIASETGNDLIIQKKRLEATIDQVREAIEDAKFAKMVMDSRTEEAKVLKQINGGLRLINNVLSESAIEHMSAKVEHNNFETIMTELNSKMLNNSTEDVIERADRILKEENNERKSSKRSS